MSQEAREIVEAAYRAINDADDDAVLSLCANDVEIEASGLRLDQGTYWGHDGVRAYAASLREVWGDSLRSYPESFVEHGDCVVVMAHTSVKGTASGVAIDAHFGHVWTIRAGKIARFQTFGRHADALEAVGLGE